MLQMNYLGVWLKETTQTLYSVYIEFYISHTFPEKEPGFSELYTHTHSILKEEGKAEQAVGTQILSKTCEESRQWKQHMVGAISIVVMSFLESGFIAGLCNSRSTILLN